MWLSGYNQTMTLDDYKKEIGYYQHKAPNKRKSEAEILKDVESIAQNFNIEGVG